MTYPGSGTYPGSSTYPGTSASGDLGTASASAALTLSATLVAPSNNLGTASMSAAATLGVSAFSIKQSLGTASMANPVGLQGAISGGILGHANASAALTLAASLGFAPLDLGHASLAAGPTLGLVMYQQGTLAYPYAIPGNGGSLSLDRAQFLTVSTDPAEVVPGSTDSFWLVFTEGEARNFFASITAAFDVPMELYVGPPDAGPGDLTLFDFDFGVVTDLGSVSLTATATTGVDLFKQLGSSTASAEVTMGAVLG